MVPPPVVAVQRAAPSAASNACSLPSSEPTYTLPPAIAGDVRTALLAVAVQAMLRLATFPTPIAVSGLWWVCAWLYPKLVQSHAPNVNAIAPIIATERTKGLMVLLALPSRDHVS